MSKKIQIIRYHRIIAHLMHGPLSFDELNHKLQDDSDIQGDNLTRSQRTLQRDINDIRELYMIEIKNKPDGKYHIISNDQQELNQRLFEALETHNALNIKGAIAKEIQFEERRPQGTHHFSGLLHAIQNNYEIKFYYKPFYEDSPSKRHIDPYLLKEFRYRWYIIGKDHKDGIVKSFGLDRIEGLEFTKVKYNATAKDSVRKRYEDCFGIVSPNAKAPSDIKISCTPMQGRYIMALPLHRSQYLVEKTENEIVLGLRVYLTYDFYMELLSFGNNIKVIEPQKLVDEMKKKLKEGAERYS